MNHEFRLVDIGEGLTEAEIVSWLVSVGDHVVEDRPVVEIETDKAVVEMPAPVTGTVVTLGGEVGAVMSVGDVLLVVDDGTADGEEAPPPTTAPVGEGPPATTAPPTTATKAAPAAAARRPLATPSTRALARQLRVDLASITGSGPGGRILDADVSAAASAPVDPSRPGRVDSTSDERVTPASGTRIVLRGVRKRTSENMTAAWRAVPHVDSFHEIDVTDLFAVARTVQAGGSPTWRLGDADRVLRQSDGPGACRAPDPQLEHRCRRRGDRAPRASPHRRCRRHQRRTRAARDPRCRPALGTRHRRHVGGSRRGRPTTPSHARGTCRWDVTVSNHGVFGGWFGTSLVHGTEVGIAGFGPARRRPEFDDDDRIVARRILVMNLAADHRVVDGRDIINFGLAIRRHLETPLELLFDPGSGP